MSGTADERFERIADERYLRKLRERERKPLRLTAEQVRALEAKLREKGVIQ